MSLFLITGINGFIGSHIAKHLINAGHKVRGLVRKTSDLKLINGMDIDLYEGDITRRDSFADAFNKVDIVIHIAGLASDWGSYESFFKINVLGTQNVATEANDNHVKRFVHISSAAIHGFPNLRNLDEQSEQPESIFNYCRTKKEAESWLFEFSQSAQMELVVLRPGNVFGPYDHTFIEKYLDALRDGKIVYIDGGKHWTCPLYVSNLAEWIAKACFEPDAAGEAIILSDGLDIDWKTFTEKFASEMQIKPPKLSIPFYAAYFIAFIMEMIFKILMLQKAPLLTRYRISNGGRDYHFSIEKAKTVLKFKPRIPFDEAVKQTAAWYKQK